MMRFYQTQKNTFAYIALLVSAALVCVFLLFGTQALAATNPKINYQGKLTNNAGAAVADGTYNMRFWLLTSPTIATTSAIWTESLTSGNRVQVENGLFSVMLGSTSALTGVNFNQTLYLGVEVGGTAGTPAWDGEMSPRKVLGTVPAAFEARKLDGVASSSFVRSDEADTIAASTASTLLTITQNGAGDILNLFDGGTEVLTVIDGGRVGIGSTTPSARLTVQGLAGTTNDIFSVASSTNTKLFTVRSTGLIGIGTSTPSRTLTVAGSARITGALYGANNSAGSNGYVLQSTGSGLNWVATSTLGLGASGATVSSVALSAPTGFSVSGSPVTTSGTLALSFDTGYELFKTASGTNWNNFYNTPSTRITDGTGLTWSSNTLNCDTASGSVQGCLTGTDWLVFNGKVSSTSIDTSAELASLLTNETGSGGLVFGTAPTLSSTTVSGILKLSSQTASRGLFTDAQSRATTTALSAALSSSITDETGSGLLVFNSNATLSSTTLSGRTTLSYASSTSLTLRGKLFDVHNNAGTNGYVLMTSGTSTRWVATSTLGLSSGGSGTVNTGASGFFTYYPSSGTTVDDQTVLNLSGNNIGVGSSTPTARLTVTGVAGSTQDIFAVASSTNTKLFNVTSAGRVGIGSTSPQSLLTLDKNTGLTGSIVAGIKERFRFTNSSANAVYYGDNAYIVNAPTATSTLVGKILRIEDSSNLGNVVRGLEVQANRGTNTKGENTAISGFGRTFGVRGTTDGDAGALFEPAGVYGETRGTTQSNALRGFSSTITTSDMLALYQSTSTFAGTGLLMNFGNGSTGSFSSSTSRFIDLQVAGASKFSVMSTGATGIGSSSPASKLTVVGTAGSTQDIFAVASSTNTKLFSIQSTGNVLVGTTTGLYSGDRMTIRSTDTSGWPLSVYIAGTPSGVARFVSNSSSNNSTIGIDFFGKDSANNFQNYGFIGSVIGSNTSGAEDGGLVFSPTSAGSLRTERMRLTAAGNLGIGTTTATAKLTVTNIGTARSLLIEDVANDTSPFMIDASGNVSIGTTTSLHKLTVAGDMLIANNATTGNLGTTTTFTTIFASSTMPSVNQTEVNALAVYDNYLYIGSGSQAGGGAKLWRYNGATTTPVWNASSTHETIREMEVFENKLYFGLGDSANNDAKVFVYDSVTATTTAAGQVGAGPNYVDGFASYQGKLYACASDDAAANVGGVWRYDGGTTWTSVHAPSNTERYGCDIMSYNGALIVVYAQQDTNGSIRVDTSVDGTTWNSIVDIDLADNGSQNYYPSLYTHDGELYVLGDNTVAGEGGPIEIFSSIATSTNNSLYSAQRTYKLSTGGNNNVFSVATYKGVTYLGSGDGISNGTGDIYQLYGGMVKSVNTDVANAMVVYNDSLYAAYGELTTAGVGARVDKLTTYPAVQQSYGLNFAATQRGIHATGTMWFEAGDKFGGFFDDVTGDLNPGVFKFSHTIISAAGAYDVAEDYPTNDQDLRAGDILAYDEENPGYLTKAKRSMKHLITGVVSARPGFLLSSKDRTGMVPTALVGRVPVNITTETGPIAIGDSVSLSEHEDGTGRKAHFGDRAIGYALESFNPDGNSTSTATGTIMLYAQIHTALGMNPDPELLTASSTDVTDTQDTLTSETVFSRMVSLVSNFVDGVLQVAGLRTDELCIGETCVNEAQLIDVLQYINTPPEGVDDGGDTGGEGDGSDGDGTGGGGDQSGGEGSGYNTGGGTGDTGGDGTSGESEGGGSQSDPPAEDSPPEVVEPPPEPPATEEPPPEEVTEPPPESSPPPA